VRQVADRGTGDRRQPMTFLVRAPDEHQPGICIAAGERYDFLMGVIDDLRMYAGAPFVPFLREARWRCASSGAIPCGWTTASSNG